MPSTPRELTLSGTPASVPSARRFVTDTLEDWGLPDAAWTSQLVVSELATNAALHARTTFTVSLTPEVGGAIRIEVKDGSRANPRMRRHDGHATTGRGLRILDELALSWGVDLMSDGKTVWVLVAAHPTLLTRPVDEDGDQADVHALPGAVDHDHNLDAPRAWAA